ncbi:MAG: serpin family protein [Planctomycetaceae bacterium]|nr:serpin family protein [Planctomycetaceae bacterium]
MKKLFTIFSAILLFGFAGIAFAEKTDVPENASVNSASLFSFDWYQKNTNSAPGQNFMTSPYGLYRLLGSLYLGSAGQTQSQFESVLRIESSPNENTKEFWLENMAGVFSSLNKSKELTFAGGIWLEENTPILPDYFSKIHKMGDLDVQNVNFSQKETLEKINAWGKEKTGGNISQILPQIPMNAKLVMANTIFFNGKWKNAFDPKDTVNAEFTGLDRKKINIPMMNRTDKYRCGSSENFQWIEIPYQGGKYAMAIFLPNKISAFRLMEEKLSMEMLDKCRSSAKTQKVSLTLPKFTFTSSSQAAPILKEMGLLDAFLTSADFSEMTSANDICVSHLVNSCCLKIDEAGTQAAVADAAVLVPKSKPIEKIIRFNVNKPFVFMIYDKDSGAILFCGRIVDLSTSRQNGGTTEILAGDDGTSGQGGSLQ